ncbi:MAG: hypothetical protein IB618_00710 [Candidatus Pacearchaeota archaeon]|nr:MAG: hypothetical protein IB618_00710 [Candidatus Pacearchaeota archaeon]
MKEEIHHKICPHIENCPIYRDYAKRLKGEGGHPFVPIDVIYYVKNNLEYKCLALENPSEELKERLVDPKPFCSYIRELNKINKLFVR